ncbi:unnamed protein product, partial [Allacma fusca]
EDYVLYSSYKARLHGSNTSFTHKLIFGFIYFVYPNATSDIAVVPLSWEKLSEKNATGLHVINPLNSKLVSKQVLPDDGWTQYSIKKTVGSVYERELEARQKQNRAVDTSDVNTHLDKKRKRIPVKSFNTVAPVKMRKHFTHVTTPVYSEDSFDESSLPLPLPTLGNSSMNEISLTTNVAGKSGVNVR